jgi:hypothetical protein
MIDLLSVSHTLLRDQAYRTRVIAIGRSSALAFEDESVLGFVYAFSTPEDLLKDWRSVERSFLDINAPRFRRSGEKAWNVYSVFLCTESVDAEHRREVHWIEEDLTYTRKLAGVGLGIRQDVVDVLLPLLGMQQRPFLQTDSFESRLRRRVRAFAGDATESLLRENAAPEDIARLLRDLK